MILQFPYTPILHRFLGTLASNAWVECVPALARPSLGDYAISSERTIPTTQLPTPQPAQFGLSSVTLGFCIDSYVALRKCWLTTHT